MTIPNMAALEPFLEKLKQAARARSQDVRFTVHEAQELLTLASALISDRVELLTEIKNLQTKLLSDQQVVSVEISGGTFK